jgi:hypothetical protein
MQYANTPIEGSPEKVNKKFKKRGYRDFFVLTFPKCLRIHSCSLETQDFDIN